MGVTIRGSCRKKLSIVISLVAIVVIYSILTTLDSPITPLDFDNENVEEASNQNEGVVGEYTLPSLDAVAQSIVDLDFQRVIAQHGAQFSEIPTKTPRVNIIIASTWRSGSTLLGEILGSYPGVYYHYEPLMSYGMVQIDQGMHQTPAVEKTLKRLLECQYVDEVSYLKYAYEKPELLVRNTRLWTFCKGMPRFKCYMNEILDKLCSMFPVHVMKLVRVRLSVLESLLQKPNTKIILLVRDPRAVMSSRTLNVDWCSSNECNSPKILCNNIEADVNLYVNLKKQYPRQIMIVRYEDLANEPYQKSENILKFVGLSMHEAVNQYLSEHLGSEVETPWSTIHDPKKQMSKWMKVSSWDLIVMTQYYCRPVMKLLGYRAFDSRSELSSENAVQLLNTYP